MRISDWSSDVCSSDLAQAKADALVKDGKITAERAAELKADARDALLEVVKPAYERVIAFAESDLPTAAVNPTGVGQTPPAGPAYYAQQQKRNTSTDLNDTQVLELGTTAVQSQPRAG